MPLPNSIRPTKIDPKDVKFSFERHFGAVTQFPDEYDADAHLTNHNQNADNRPTACTAYTITDIGTDQDKEEYSVEYQLARTFEAMNVDSNQEGADARTAFKVPVVFGLLPKKVAPDVHTLPQEKATDGALWPASFDTKTVKKPAYIPIQQGSFDWFDAIRNALLLGENEKRTVGMATRWSSDFSSSKLPDSPRVLYWGHMYKVRGWKTLPGINVLNQEPYLWLKTWEGVDRFMSRTLCNKLMGEWGSYAGTLRDLPTGTIDELLQQKTSIKEFLIALLQNLLRIRWTPS